MTDAPAPVAPVVAPQVHPGGMVVSGTTTTTAMRLHPSEQVVRPGQHHQLELVQYREPARLITRSTVLCTEHRVALMRLLSTVGVTCAVMVAPIMARCDRCTDLGVDG